jgi:hypothetical protein
MRTGKSKSPSRAFRQRSASPGTKTLPSPTPTFAPASKPNVGQTKSPASLPAPQPKIEAIPTEKKVNKKTW